mgnify:CR=1 FL=1
MVICNSFCLLFRWDLFAKKLCDGDITFHEVEQVLGNFIREVDGVNLSTEMIALGLAKETIVERKKQLHQNRDLSTCVEGANVILEFKKEYKLTGDFEAIKGIASVSKLF